MREQTITLLLSLLRSALQGAQLSDSDRLLCTDEAVTQVLNIAREHDMAHLICTSLLENKLLPENAQKYQSFLYKAIYRYEGQNYELNRARELLERIGVPFILLKGSVMRKYYSSPWLRTSCDIDILVKKEDLSRAQSSIAQELEYTPSRNSTHDISLLSANGVCLELHFELKETDFREARALSDIWSGQEIAALSEFEYGMSNELFLFYHIYHMAKHFVHGGCGIKPLVDLWIIKNKMGYDEEKAKKLLQGDGLLEFYNKALSLTEVWFNNKKYTPIEKEMEDYILQGGVYGSLEQQLAMSQSKKGGSFKHLMSKIFISYRAMLIYYPSLKKCPVLFPIYQVRRWCRIAFCGGGRRAMNEIRLNQNLSQIKTEKAKKLIDELGL